MKKIFDRYCYILILALVYSVPVNAQDTTLQKSTRSHWSFLVEPYVMFPHMNGDIAVSTLPEVSVDATPGDIFNRLEHGLMIGLEARNEKWAITSDLIYMNLSQDVKQGVIINGGEASVKQIARELAGLRKVLPWLEVGVAGIINTVKSDVDISVNNVGGATTDKSASISETWVEPMITARIKSPSDKIYIYHFRGEIGGFGIGSSLAWQAEVDAGFRFSKLMHVTAGYRVISLDYEKGSGSDLFVYDINTFGPVIRVGFNF